MSFLIDVAVAQEIFFTLNPDGALRAWQVQSGEMVEMEPFSAVRAVKEDNMGIAHPLVVKAAAKKPVPAFADTLPEDGPSDG